MLRGQAYASASGDNTNTGASTNTQTRFTAFVNAAAPPVVGGAGLNFGDTVSLDLSFRLDGILRSGAAPGDNTGSSYMNADLEIVDPNIQLDCGSPDGCYTPKLVDFRGGADTISYGSGETFNGWNWSLSTRNGLDELIDSLSDSDSWVITPGATCQGPGPCGDVNFDTGILSTTIETTIGAELDIFARLNIFSDAWNFQGDGGFGSADFFNTYGLLLTPITEGVELGYDITPATNVVPIPAAVWLFSSGLIGLIGIARRKKA